ncbi:hypothetical protein D3C73_1388600 [compost metagenome]
MLRYDGAGASSFRYGGRGPYSAGLLPAAVASVPGAGSGTRTGSDRPGRTPRGQALRAVRRSQSAPRAFVVVQADAEVVAFGLAHPGRRLRTARTPV